ncbi:16S rRNA (cytidine(1402)-2'-O)-methyltransferase [Dermatophilus congolensis]|uniref:Ribosomal RNA small subunit methyltransferase I n=1 Tax=Dermatophilus congolensis TaxID=1863 RepID=A0A239VU43_9MICO|nr:16S rRNA (cytidine(1402)-2'-O)-methyltransferase [Dermatophilus congolensis]MBO3129910.1 16S rRNA (cytidine(1402)-2'-O)-methyltransferase [Dermatophilus congolensis]MBO3131460.1 16S rRNA (cytidine(1402)-2'-O)-methyltransferase [Dermatophilus congolensis]MBO3134384.1 16S rRNA (cytidine(1402)-2'-O)-methyltransferase [Dermatophilus congolensis]MBO3136619.1 16S rRNA (cytidine(1402)-2'-O)-methyltransferase [Dermatophilus congolensis]MBO3138863.1 16S rRNA (cytidine(1402)-2'-O)-methyltransferase [
MSGTLFLAATPIGNDGDASLRLRELLQSAPVIAAEDTRRLTRLCERLGIRYAGEAVSFHEHNEASKAPELVERLKAGVDVLLVTDAGMPSVSDPGYRLVVEAVQAQVTVTCLPGPSAALTALAVSGLPVDRFCFEGFLPRKAGPRAAALEQVTQERRTLIYFEAPHRTAATLAAMLQAFGADRSAAVCRELTKTYEEVVRGTLAELVEWAKGEIRGEIVIVVAGACEVEQAVDFESAVEEVAARVAAGEKLTTVTATVAKATGHSRKELYNAFVAK